MMLDVDSINERTHAAVAAYHAPNKPYAKQLCEEILAMMPVHPYALNLKAVLLMDEGQLDLALDLFDQLLNANPADEQGTRNREVCINRMMQRNEPWLHRALHYYRTGRLPAAISIYREAIEFGADSDTIHGNLGAHLHELGDWGEAENHYQQALSLNPLGAATLYNFGSLLSLQHRHGEAKALLLRAIAVQPDYMEAHLSLGHLLAQSGELDAAMRSFDKAIACAPQNALSLSAKLFNLAYLPSTTASDMYAMALQFASHTASDLQADDALKGSARLDLKLQPVLKIGFISGDFKDHPVGYFTENLLRQVNRERFEWHIFSNFESSDAVATRLKTLATSWTPIAGQSDEVAKALIADKGIDVLFDLSGHTALHRLTLFASRAAPVQITWLGWHDTTGLANMDYLLTDYASIPPVVRQDGVPYLAETPLYLPRTRLCMMPPADAPAVTSQPMSRKGYITFGSMQILAKLSNVSIKLWARILSQVPTARLAIRCRQFREAEVMESFKKKCTALGLPIARVDLLPPLGRGDYLASYADIDILLDSYPYPGGTTTAEALWMGVPTITMGGNTMISRQGVSLLTAAGLQDWIATSEANYVTKAITWANHPEQLQALRKGLRAQVTKTALFDGAQFARDFENAMREAVNS